MRLVENLNKLISLMEDRRSIRAILTWPKFSFSSFILVSRLSRQGILPKTVLDLGANVGQFTIASSKLWTGVHVHAFEPLPECIEALRANVRGFPNVTVYPLAVGDSEGELDFFVNSYNQVSSALPLSRVRLEAFPDAQVISTLKVPLTTLDKTLSGQDLPEPVLLKMDVQGYEDRVLKGAAAVLQHVHYVLMELSLVPLYEGELVFMEMVAMMQGYGFRFLRPINWLLSPQGGEMLEVDALFIRADRPGS